MKMNLQLFAKATDENEQTADIVEVDQGISPDEYLEEKVPIQLIKDGDRYKDDVVIGLNGEKIMIQRGITVMIKRKFALILENQYRQQMVAANLENSLVEQYEENKRSLE